MEETLIKAIRERHSVRAYTDLPLPAEVTSKLQEKINACNQEGNLHIQLVQNEPKAFNGLLARYGKFIGVRNYLVMAGQKSKDLDERCGYYGEQLVILAQSIGLNSCWVGLSYRKIPGTYTLHQDEKVTCYIALGYGQTSGTMRKSKRIDQVSNYTNNSPEWFRKGIELALLAPTAINQQKFFFELLPSVGKKYQVAVHTQFSFAGYTQMDLGIAKYHFELGAGTENFEFKADINN